MFEVNKSGKFLHENEDRNENQLSMMSCHAKNEEKATANLVLINNSEKYNLACAGGKNLQNE